MGAQMVEGNGPTIMLVLRPASAHPLDYNSLAL